MGYHILGELKLTKVSAVFLEAHKASLKGGAVFFLTIYRDYCADTVEACREIQP